MTTQSRLDAYLAAEAEIVKAQEVRAGDRTHRRAELQVVQVQIAVLQRQLAREQAAAAGRGSINFAVANLSRE